jgi:hypothetical protein
VDFFLELARERGHEDVVRLLTDTHADI